MKREFKTVIFPPAETFVIPPVKPVLFVKVQSYNRTVHPLMRKMVSSVFTRIPVKDEL